MTDPITLTVRITNSYPGVGRTFTHDESVTIDAPAAEAMADPDRLDDWALDTLIPFTGDGLPSVTGAGASSASAGPFSQPPATRSIGYLLCRHKLSTLAR